jgi:hypothetical protein
MMRYDSGAAVRPANFNAAKVWRTARVGAKVDPDSSFPIIEDLNRGYFRYKLTFAP